MNQEFKWIQQDLNAMAEHSEPTKNPDLSSVIWSMENLKQDLGIKHRSEFNSDLDKLGKQLHDKLGLPPANILDVANGELFTQEKVKGGGQGRVHVLDANLNCIDDQVARSAMQGDTAGALQKIEDSMRGLSKDDPDYYRAKEAFTRALNESMPGRAPVTIEMYDGKLIAYDSNYRDLLPPKVQQAETPASDAPPRGDATGDSRPAAQVQAPAEITDHRTAAQRAAAEKFWKDHDLDDSPETNPDGGKTVRVIPGDNIWNFAAKEMEERQGHVMSVTDRNDMRNVLGLTKETAADNEIKIQPDGKALIRPNDWLHIPAER